ncbi:MAG: AAA family ATPase [Methanomicrobiales archaeon]|nr:AAA family ATPase [Methanomicrobiales archaeon]MDI6876523.1 AAA family ATPase [Methanomicrobiales archaeon]
MKVIGVVGLPASGKGEFSRIARGMGIPVVVMGDVIRAAVEEEGLPLTDRNLGDMANRLRREEGMDAIAQRTLPLLAGLDADRVVVDGIRGDAEVETFRRHCADFTLVGICCGFEIRAQRLSRRGRSDDPRHHAELRERDRRELAWGLGRALAEADYTVCNEGTVAEFEESVIRLLSNLQGA